MRKTTGILVLFASVLVAITPVAAQPADEAPIATGKVTGTILTVSPKIPFASATLRVAGPAGYEAIAWSAGEPLTLDLLTDGWIAASDGAPGGTPAVLPEGRYGYEVVFYMVDGSRRVHDGRFRVQRGAVSGPSERGHEPLLREGLRREEEGLRKVTAASGSTDDWFWIKDARNDGNTELRMSSDLVSDFDGRDWFISNDLGHLALGEWDEVSGIATLKNHFAFTPEGRLGIGTTNPLADLHIYTGGGTFRITDRDPCDWTPSGASWQIEEDATRLMFAVALHCPLDPVGGKMWLTQGGRLGIGTSDPQQSLHLVNGGGTNEIRLQSGSGYRDIVAFSDGGMEIQGTSGERAVRIFPSAPDNGLVLSSSGVGIGIAAPLAKLHVMGNGIIEGDVSLGSSRTIKHEIEPLDGGEVLSVLRDLPIYTWKYRDDPVQAAHAGPMAEDVHAAFRLGRDDKHLSPADSAGLALAAIRGVDERLERELEALRDRNAQLASANEELGELLARMEERLRRLEGGEE